MKLKLRFLITALFVLAIYIPAARAQANLTFSGGNDTPLTITLQQSVSYTITNSNCSADGPIFIFDEAGNPFSGSGPLVNGTMTFSINGGTAQSVSNSNSGVAANNVTPNDIFVYGNLGNSILIGNTVVLSAGTVTTTGNVAAAPPASGAYATFLTNAMGVVCSSSGAASAPTAASVSVSGRVLTNNRRGLANAFVYLTDENGNTQISRTNPFGYYRFEGVQAGQTVTMTIVSKRFQFAPQVINLNEDVSQLNFVSEP